MFCLSAACGPSGAVLSPTRVPFPLSPYFFLVMVSHVKWDVEAKPPERSVPSSSTSQALKQAGSQISSLSRGQKGKGPADLVGIHMKRKEKSLFKHHASYTARQMNAAFHTSPCFSALALLMSHLETGQRSPELLLRSDHCHSEGVHPWKSLFFLPCSLFVVDQGPSDLL